MVSGVMAHSVYILSLIVVSLGFWAYFRVAHVFSFLFAASGTVAGLAACSISHQVYPIWGLVTALGVGFFAAIALGFGVGSLCDRYLVQDLLDKRGGVAECLVSTMGGYAVLQASALILWGASDYHLLPYKELSDFSFRVGAGSSLMALLIGIFFLLTAWAASPVNSVLIAVSINRELARRDGLPVSRLSAVLSGSGCALVAGAAAAASLQGGIQLESSFRVFLTGAIAVLLPRRASAVSVLLAATIIGTLQFIVAYTLGQKWVEAVGPGVGLVLLSKRRSAWRY